MLHLEQVTGEGETVVEEIFKADEEQWTEEGDNEGELVVEELIVWWYQSSMHLYC